jgi:hypothetical protein
MNEAMDARDGRAIGQAVFLCRSGATVPADHPLRAIRGLVNEALTDIAPDARLYRKNSGAGAKLCYMGHVLMENRNGLAVDAETTPVAGFAERLTAVAMLDDVDRAEGSGSRWRPTGHTTPATSSTSCGSGV